MPKNLILVELPDPQDTRTHEKNCPDCMMSGIGSKECQVITKLIGFNECLDSIQSKSVRVDVGKLAKFLYDKQYTSSNPWIAWEVLSNFSQKHWFEKAKSIKQAIESGELFEEGKP